MRNFNGIERSLSYLPIGSIAENQPPAVRLSTCLAPSGMVLLLFAAMLASGISVCTEGCERMSNDLEDKLLRCMDRCEVSGKKPEDHRSNPCESKCHEQVGFTRREVKHKQEQCEDQCEGNPFFLRLFSILATIMLVPVTPCLASYKDSCRCECCIGEGCNRRLSLYTISFTLFGFSCLWVMPTVLEDPDEVGGKVLFGLAQGISMVFMYASRMAAERDQMPVSTSAPPSSNTGSHQMAAIVGAPVSGPSPLELQAQIKELQLQVRELARLQTLQTEARVKGEDAGGMNKSPVELSML